MSSVKRLSDLSSGDQIDITGIEELIRNHFASSMNRYAISGSLLDYMIDKHTPIVTYQKAGENLDYQLEFDWPEESLRTRKQPSGAG